MAEVEPESSSSSSSSSSPSSSSSYVPAPSEEGFVEGDPERPRRTLLTVDHFREIERFNEWLDNLEYPFAMPGIPKGTL